MSRRAPLAAVRLAVVGVLGLHGGALDAQASAELLARREALQVRAESLNARVAALASAAQDAGLDAAFTAVGLRMHTTTAQRAVAEVALQDAMAEARRVLGAEADSIAARLRLTLRERRSAIRESYSPIAGYSVAPMPERITSLALEGEYAGRAVPGASLDAPLRRHDLALGVVSLLERAAALRLPEHLDAWLNHRVPVSAEPSDFRVTLYRTLATDPAGVVRRCAAGDRGACRLGFALDSLPTDRVAAWYDESDLPSLAASAGDQTQRSWMVQTMGRDARAACVERGHLDTCRQMLALLPADAIRVPMPWAARLSLMRLAMATGGPEALGRLAATREATVGAQLAAAAGIPLDELVDRWTRQMVAARPTSPLPGPTFVFASLACIVVCVGWAMRGQPWK